MNPTTRNPLHQHRLSRRVPILAATAAVLIAGLPCGGEAGWSLKVDKVTEF